MRTRLFIPAVAAWLAVVLPVFTAAGTAVTGPVAHVYAVHGGVELRAHVFAPARTSADERRAAIVLLHGGGWYTGEAGWTFPRATHYAEHGMVAVAVQYRLSDQKEVTPIDAIADVCAALRWVRSRADSLGIDPERVAAYGWSAGGHLAVSAVLFDDGVVRGLPAAAPNALVLVSPAVSLGSDNWFQRLLVGRARAKDLTPDEHVRSGMPPTLILQGDIDTVTPLEGARRFAERMLAAGNRCELHVYEGYGHVFTPAGIPDDGMPQPDPAISADAKRRADEFLKSLGYMQ